VTAATPTCPQFSFQDNYTIQPTLHMN